MLARPGAAMCFTCHDKSGFQRTNKHKAMENGCTTCHDPHSSDQGALLARNEAELCGKCHADMSKHLHPTKGRDPRTDQELKCSGCHDAHSSDQVALLRFEPRRELCVQCHANAMSDH